MKYSYQVVAQELDKPHRHVVNILPDERRHCECSDCCHEVPAAAVVKVYCDFACDIALCQDAFEQVARPPKLSSESENQLFGRKTL